MWVHFNPLLLGGNEGHTYLDKLATKSSRFIQGFFRFFQVGFFSWKIKTVNILMQTASINLEAKYLLKVNIKNIKKNGKFA